MRECVFGKYRSVIARGKEVRLVGVGIIVDVVNTLGFVAVARACVSGWQSKAESLLIRSTYASSVKLAVGDPSDHILTVRSRQAEAKVFVSLGLMARPMT